MEINKGRNLKGKELNMLSKLARSNRISELEIIINPVSENQKRTNGLIKEYENTHNKPTNFNIEIQKKGLGNQGLNF